MPGQTQEERTPKSRVAIGQADGGAVQWVACSRVASAEGGDQAKERVGRLWHKQPWQAESNSAYPGFFPRDRHPSLTLHRHIPEPEATGDSSEGKLSDWTKNRWDWI